MTTENAGVRGLLRPGAGMLVAALAGLPALVTALECHTVAIQQHPEMPLLPSLLYGAVLWLWWAPVAHLLWIAGRRHPHWLRLTWANVAGHVMVGVAVVAAHLWLMGVISWFIARTWPTMGPAGGRFAFFTLQRVGLELLIYGLIWLGCAAARTQLVAQRAALEAAQLEQQLVTAQLTALQMQMEPHFLLNTLNAITALVELKRNDEAATTLARLNGMLQTTLERRTPLRVPLKRELRLVEDYLAIERVRFADRLTVEIDVDPAALNGMVPCFLLQPIVENSIRHGVARLEAEGRIEARVERRDAWLYLSVRDNGPGLQGTLRAGNGIGLRNTEARLRHFYDRAFTMSLEEPAEGGFRVSITLPYEPEAQQA